MWKTIGLLLTVSAAGFFLGCDPVTVHKVTSTVFDGVPSLPPAEQYCQEYHEKKLAELESAAKASAEGAAAVKGSRHSPYVDKLCDECHDKTKPSGLTNPPDKLCFLCHPDILDGPSVHSPAAEGDCLGCHEPHSSSRSALLKSEIVELCISCHGEKRNAETIHQNFVSKGLICTDCHNPHAGNGSYFFK